MSVNLSNVEGRKDQSTSTKEFEQWIFEKNG